VRRAASCRLRGPAVAPTPVVDRIMITSATSRHHGRPVGPGPASRRPAKAGASALPLACTSQRASSPAAGSKGVPSERRAKRAGEPSLQSHRSVQPCRHLLSCLPERLLFTSPDSSALGRHRSSPPSPSVTGPFNSPAELDPAAAATLSGPTRRSLSPCRRNTSQTRPAWSSMRSRASSPRTATSP
jgi:hypothetical protein